MPPTNSNQHNTTSFGAGLFQQVPDDIPGDTDLSRARMTEQGHWVLPPAPAPASVQRRYTPPVAEADYATERGDEEESGGGIPPLWRWLIPVAGLVGVCLVAFLLFQLAQPPKVRTARPIAFTYSTTATYRVTFNQEQLNQYRLLHSAEAELVLEDSGTATGTIQVPDAAATGQVRLFNPNERAIGLAAGTVVATGPNGVSYRLVQAVSVPATSVAAGASGFLVTNVQAVQAGPVGNLPGGLGTYTLGSGLRLAGVGPITGGTTRPAKAATKEDIQALQQKLLDQAREQTNNGSALSKVWPAGGKAFGTPELKDVKIQIDQQADQEAGATGQFKGKLTAKVSQSSYILEEVFSAAITTEKPINQTAAFRPPVLTKVDQLPGEQGLTVWYTRQFNLNFQLKDWVFHS